MTVSAEMPRYETRKTVWALKIASIDYDGDKCDGAVITPEEPRYAPFSVDGAYVAKHKPQVGGYYVVYPDGYKSWSPAHAFESSASRVN
jgi:hypothetical protein